VLKNKVDALLVSTHGLAVGESSLVPCEQLKKISRVMYVSPHMVKG
jgi:hypothetical protein